MFDIEKVSGISEFAVAEETVGAGDDAEEITVYRVLGRAFLVVRKNTLEMRTDRKLLNLLRERYESVMESRYFGRGGIEIVNSGQLTDEEVCDLVRLSYDLSKEA